MLTDRQRMQIRRSVGYKHGFLPETVSLESHEAVDIGRSDYFVITEGGAYDEARNKR